MIKAIAAAAICIGLLFLPLCASALDLSHYVRSGDIYFEQGKTEAALREYKAGLVLDGDDYGLLWRAARTYGRLSVTVTKKREAADYILKQEEFARKAISANPEGFEGHLYLAEALAKLLAHAPFNKVFRYVLEIHDAAGLAIEIDPNEAKPYVILGTWHRMVATAPWYQKTLLRTFFGKLPEADLAVSLSLLKKAVELDATRPKYHYELALSYEALDDYKSAARQLREAIRCEPSHQWDEKIITQAQERLKTAQYRD